MPSGRTLLSRLKNMRDYLDQYPQSHHSARFEELICQSFAVSLHLPFYNVDNDDTSVENRVVWFGRDNPISKSPHGSDGVAYSHNFCIVIEATMKTGTNQWSQEFHRCLQHAKDVANDTGLDEKDVYVAFIVTKIHNNTYNSVRSHNQRGNPKIAVKLVDNLIVALETSYLAYTMKHVELRALMHELISCLSNSQNTSDYEDRSKNCVNNWQKDVLGMEKNTFLAIRSYRAMIKDPAEQLAMSEIYTRLSRDTVIRCYFNKIFMGGFFDLDPYEIPKCLEQESLGSIIGKHYTGEPILCPVPFLDFQSRCQRTLKEVERIHGGG